MTIPLIVVALPTELDNDTIPDHQILHTQVGKVNATLNLTRALANDPSITQVINYGTAGAVNPAVQGLLEVSRILQRDMLPGELAPRGITPFDPSPNEFILNQHSNITCATGDSFVQGIDPWFAENKVDIVDMESFAFAKVCFSFGVEFQCLKFVSDMADETALNDWEANVAKGRSLFVEWIHSQSN